jgi:hypothetical protein
MQNAKKKNAKNRVSIVSICITCNARLRQSEEVKGMAVCTACAKAMEAPYPKADTDDYEKPGKRPWRGRARRW